jgi:hypothetical protein
MQLYLDNGFKPYTFLIELLEHYKRKMMVRQIRNEIRRHINENDFSEKQFLYVLDDLKRMGLIKVEGDFENGIWVSLTYNYKKISESGNEY